MIREWYIHCDGWSPSILVCESRFHDQEYPTEPLDKIPALQAEFELAGKKNLAS